MSVKIERDSCFENVLDKSSAFRLRKAIEKKLHDTGSLDRKSSIDQKNYQDTELCRDLRDVQKRLDELTWIVEFGHDSENSDGSIYMNVDHLHYYKFMHKLICRADLDPDFLINSPHWPTTLLCEIIKRLGPDDTIFHNDGRFNRSFAEHLHIDLCRLIGLGIHIQNVKSAITEDTIRWEYLLPLLEATKDSDDGLSLDQIVNAEDNYTILHCCAEQRTSFSIKFMKYWTDESNVLHNINCDKILTRNGDDCLKLALLSENNELIMALITAHEKCEHDHYSQSRLDDALLLVLRFHDLWPIHWDFFYTRWLKARKRYFGAENVARINSFKFPELKQFVMSQGSTDVTLSRFARDGYKVISESKHEITLDDSVEDEILFSNFYMYDFDDTPAMRKLVRADIAMCIRMFGTNLRRLTLGCIRRLLLEDSKRNSDIVDHFNIRMFCLELFMINGIFTTARKIELEEALDNVDYITSSLERNIRELKKFDMDNLYHYINLLLKVVYEREKPHSLPKRTVNTVEILPLDNLGNSIERCLLLITEYDTNRERKLELIRRVGDLESAANGIKSTLFYNLITSDYSVYDDLFPGKGRLGISMIELITELILNSRLLINTRYQPKCLCQIRLDVKDLDNWYFHCIRKLPNRVELIKPLIEAIRTSGCVFENVNSTACSKKFDYVLDFIKTLPNNNKLSLAKLSCLAARVIKKHNLEYDTSLMLEDYSNLLTNHKYSENERDWARIKIQRGSTICIEPEFRYCELNYSV